MREVQVSDAVGHLAQWLDAVERGETVIITRAGRPIARIVPEACSHGTDIDQAIDAISDFRRHRPAVSLEEIRAMIDEGRRS